MAASDTCSACGAARADPTNKPVKWLTEEKYALWMILAALIIYDITKSLVEKLW